MSFNLYADSRYPLTLGSGTPYALKPPLEGLETSPIRTSSYDYSGRDGGEVPEQFYSMRQISIPGAIVSNCDTHEDDRKALRLAFPIRQSVPLYVTTFSGKVYRVDAKVVDFKMPIVSDSLSDFKIELLCGDPLIYDESEGGLWDVTVTRKFSGGYVTPYILPVIWQPSSLPVNVTNSGESDIYPTILITGVGTNPVISNLTTGELMQVNVSLRQGDVLTLDMRNRVATLNGGSVIGLKTSNSTWWRLAQGDNIIELDSLNGSDTVIAHVTWNSGQMGL